MVDVVATDEFETWYEGLAEDEALAVTRAVTLLESVGVEHPRVKSVEVDPRFSRGQKLTLYELAVEGGTQAVLFALETENRAVLLYGCGEPDLARSVVDLPAVAYVMLAAKVYWQYRQASKG